MRAPSADRLSVARAAHVLGIHPNTLRAWSDTGRLPAVRVNRRGDRRYRLADLETFLAAASGPGVAPCPSPGDGAWVSPAGAARILGIHPNTVRTWTELGRLPAVRINARGDRRYRLSDIAAFLIQAALD